MKNRLNFSVSLVIKLTLFLLIVLSSQQLFAQVLEPANLPLKGGTWSFSNYSTNRLSADTFEKAFGLKWYNWINPVVSIVFYSYNKELAKNGNCFGMCLLADHTYSIENYNAPFTGRIDKPIWRNYPAASGNIRKAISTYHWRQLSVGCLKSKLERSTWIPRRIAEQIKRDVQAGRLGYVTITHNNGGHALIPIDAWVYENHCKIFVYDPNRPYSQENASLTALRNFILISDQTDRNNWSYQMGGSTWTNRDGRLNYITYDRSRLYSKLPTNIVDWLIIICGNNTKIEQIGDNTGKKLFKSQSNNYWADIDFSSSGLANSIIKFTPISQRATLNQMAIIKSTNLGALMQKKYNSKFDKNIEVYFVNVKKLKQLNLKIKQINSSKNTLLILSQGSNSFELDIASKTKGKSIEPEISILNVANLTQGVLIHDRKNEVSKLKTSYNSVNKDANRLTIQTAQNLTYSAYKIKLSFSVSKELVIRSKAETGSTTLFKKSIDRNGLERTLPSKTIQIQKF